MEALHFDASTLAQLPIVGIMVWMVLQQRSERAEWYASMAKVGEAFRETSTKREEQLIKVIETLDANLATYADSDRQVARELGELVGHLRALPPCVHYNPRVAPVALASSQVTQ